MRARSSCSGAQQKRLLMMIMMMMICINSESESRSRMHSFTIRLSAGMYAVRCGFRKNPTTKTVLYYSNQHCCTQTLCQQAWAANIFSFIRPKRHANPLRLRIMINSDRVYPKSNNHKAAKYTEVRDRCTGDDNAAYNSNIFSAFHRPIVIYSHGKFKFRFVRRKLSHNGYVNIKSIILA